MPQIELVQRPVDRGGIFPVETEIRRFLELLRMGFLGAGPENIAANAVDRDSVGHAVEPGAERSRVRSSKASGSPDWQRSATTCPALDPPYPFTSTVEGNGSAVQWDLCHNLL